MSKTIPNSVRAAIFIEGKILLVKRKDIPIWELPGGAIDNSETPEEAVLREIKEETGIDANIDRKVALYSSDSFFIKPVYLYKLSAKNNLFSPCKKEVKQIDLFSIDMLPKNLAPYFDQWILDAKEDKPYFEKIIKDITLYKLIKYFLSHPIISIRYILMRCRIHLNFLFCSCCFALNYFILKLC
jgi:8-oxo-dGTP diphosphatase